MEIAGGITGHLAALESAILSRLRWKAYLAMIERRDSGLRNVPQEALFPDGEPDQMPDQYFTYLQCKRWNKLYFDGALADQPHLFMEEVEACRRAEERFQDAELPRLKQLETEHEVSLKQPIFAME